MVLGTRKEFPDQNNIKRVIEKMSKIFLLTGYKVKDNHAVTKRKI